MIFDVNHDEVPLEMQMELLDLQCSKDLKSKFLAFNILDFYKNQELPSGWLSNHITLTQRAESMLAQDTAVNNSSAK